VFGVGKSEGRVDVSWARGRAPMKTKKGEPFVGARPGNCSTT